MDFHDPFASASHLFTAGFVLFAGLVLLAVARRHSTFRRLALAGYAASAVFLYTASGLFHGVRFASDADREFFRRLDLSGIFLLIAGSHLPAFAYLLNGRWRTAMSVATPALAAAGVAAVCVLPSVGSAVLVPVYAAVAVAGLIPVRVYLRAGGWRVLRWMLGAAAVYAAGGVCEVLHWPTVWPGVVGPHEVLHLTDVGGTLVHLGLVANLVAGNRVNKG